MMRQHLGPEIARARKIQSSPLFVRGPVPDDPPLDDKTADNLFLRGRWSDMIAHFRYALICKGLMFRFLIVTDERIKNVFVGNESARVKPKEERETTKSYNSLSDLVCDHDLVILLLGYLGHKNVAMAGALKEALMLREVAHKATWIVDKADYPFVVGHHSYSEDVADYIFSHFEVLDVPSTSTPSEEQDDRPAPYVYSGPQNVLVSAPPDAALSVEEWEPSSDPDPEPASGGDDLGRPDLADLDAPKAPKKFKFKSKRGSR
jgi:hypothetical protein